MTTQKIEVFGREDSQDRSLFSRGSDMRYGRGSIDPAELQERLTNFLHSMRDVIDGVPGMLGSFQITSVTLTAEVTAKGSVSLLGTGGEVAGKGGLTFTLQRSVDQKGNVGPNSEEG